MTTSLFDASAGGMPGNSSSSTKRPALQAVPRPGVRLHEDGVTATGANGMPARADLVRDEDGLTQRERSFVDLLIGGMMDPSGALDIGRAWQEASGCAETSRNVGAAQAVARPQVRDALRKLVQAGLEAMAPRLVQGVMRLGLHGKSEYVRLEALRMLLDRAGYKPAERVEVGIGHSVSISIDLGGHSQVVEGEASELPYPAGGADADRGLDRGLMRDADPWPETRAVDADPPRSEGDD